MRSSRQDTEKHREAIIDAAARMVREKGIDGLSIPALMAEVGMTHGGFYRHFASKEALAPLAFSRAFEMIDQLLQTVSAHHPADPDGALRELADNYLSPAHRDNPGAGCATSALAGDIARLDCGCTQQQSYVSGVEQMVGELESVLGDTSAAGHRQALVTLSTMVGALLLSRATRGSAMSDALLTAAREAVSPPIDAAVKNIAAPPLPI